MQAEWKTGHFGTVKIGRGLLKTAIIELNLGQIHEYHLLFGSRLMLLKNQGKRRRINQGKSDF